MRHNWQPPNMNSLNFLNASSQPHPNNTKTHKSPINYDLKNYKPYNIALKIYKLYIYIYLYLIYELQRSQTLASFSHFDTLSW